MTWDSFFIGMAEYVSTKSKDPSTRVGCVIVRPDNTVASVGFNGFPRGADDDVERMKADRDWKLARTLHAEINAVLSAYERLSGCTAYVWPMPPCSQCASTLAQSGITRVVALHPRERWAESCMDGRAMLDECGVQSDWFAHMTEFTPAWPRTRLWCW